MSDARKHGAGKGDRYRPVDRSTFNKNYEGIFGVREIKTWIPDPKDDPRKTTHGAKAKEEKGSPRDAR